MPGDGTTASPCMYLEDSDCVVQRCDDHPQPVQLLLDTLCAESLADAVRRIEPTDDGWRALAVALESAAGDVNPWP